MGCRKESYFLEFMYADVARDFVGAVVHVLLDGAKGSHNHWDCIIIIIVVVVVVIIIIIIIITITINSLVSIV